MNWLKENWFKIGLLGMLGVAIVSYFYWYEIRPSQVRKRCVAEAYSGFGSHLPNRDDVFDICLKRFGISK